MGPPRDPVNHLPKKDVGPPSFPLTASNLNPEIVVRYVQFIPIRLAASLHERDALLELVSLYGSGMPLCACSDRCSEESTAIKRGMARMAPWSAAARSHLGASLRSAATLPPGHSVVRCADRRRASSRLPIKLIVSAGPPFMVSRVIVAPTPRGELPHAGLVARSRPVPPPSALVRRQRRYGCCLAIIVG